jgi:hypothetical protein
MAECRDFGDKVFLRRGKTRKVARWIDAEPAGSATYVATYAEAVAGVMNAPCTCLLLVYDVMLCVYVSVYVCLYVCMYGTR